MRFLLESSTLSKLIKASFAGTLALAIVTACSDTISAPTEAVRPLPAGVFVVETQVPDSEKNPAGLSSGSMLSAPGSAAANLVGPSASFSSLAAAAPYAVSAVAFAPEEDPIENNGPICDDCVMFNVPLGFDFAFYGVSYSTLNISSNGFVGFGPSLGNGCCKGGMIPSNDVTNNIIALGWSDWRPQLVPGGIKYETRGEAPNRRFVLQFNNVPEFGSTGRLTVQLVLHEETHDIEIHTTKLSTIRSDHIVTQGLENATGLLSASLPGRVRTFLKLDRDGVRFTPAPNLRPVLSVPADISLDLEIGSCSAVVDAGSAEATDDTEGFSISPERSDLLPLDEPYPAGVTTIVWTVTDAGGLKASANQTITLRDKDAPSIVAPADRLADNDAGLGSAVVDAGSAVAEDKCGQVSVEGVRSDAADLSAPFPVGVTTITWTALDVSGNSAAATQKVTVVDVEAPYIGGLSDLSVDATSRTGAVVTFAARTSDNVAVTSVECDHASGSFFKVGPTSVTCTAKDAAGNEASEHFVVTVRGPADLLNDLINDVVYLDLSGGVANPMLNQLRAAIDGLDAPDHVSCKKLEDFLKALTSSKARAEMTADELRALITEAKHLQSVLGCS